MIVNLGDVATYINGYAFKPSDWSNDGLPIIRIQDLTGTSYQTNRYKGSYDEKYEINNGDVLISWSASLGVYVWQSEKALLNQHIFKVAFNKLEVNKDFFVLQVKQLLNKYAGSAHGATMKHLTKQVFNSLPFYLPDIKTQQEIAKKLSVLNIVISQRNLELQKLDDLIKSRFVEMFDCINDMCTVGDYIKTLIAGKSLAGEEECKNKVLKTGAVSFDFFDCTQVKNLPLDYNPQNEHVVKQGDIIISRMNTAELTGAAAYVWSVPERVYLPDRLWKAELKDGCNPIFVWQMLIQPSAKEQIRRNCSGTSGSMKNISKPSMLAINVKRVPLDLQNQFASFVTQIDKLKFLITHLINTSKRKVIL